MSESTYTKNRQQLEHLMQQVKIANLKELSRLSGVSQWQLTRLEYGLILKIPVEDFLKLANTLQVSLNDLLTLFSPDAVVSSSVPEPIPDNTEELDALKQDYQRLHEKMEKERSSLTQEFQRLQQKMEQQKETLTTEFQRSSLETLESWLLQWPTAASSAQKNPKLPATKLLPLLKPMAALLKQWGVEAIGCVGELAPYDPQSHELIEGQAEPGERVRVRYVGYRQGDKLLHRAKVSSLDQPTSNKETAKTLEDTTVLDVAEDSPITVLDVSEDAAVDEETAKNIIS